jgi:peptidoglycan/LPS O-acetylase OafA/YrhL
VYMRQATWQERLARWLRAPLVVPVLLGLCYASSVMHGGERLARFGIAFMVDGPLIAMLILSASAVATFGQGWAARLLRQTTLVSIGRVSYFMYLFHGMIMYTTANLVVRHTGSFWLGLVTALVAVYAVARLSFAWIETPARLWITRQAG